MNILRDDKKVVENHLDKNTVHVDQTDRAFQITLRRARRRRKLWNPTLLCVVFSHFLEFIGKNATTAEAQRNTIALEFYALATRKSEFRRRILVNFLPLSDSYFAKNSREWHLSLADNLQLANLQHFFD